MIVIKEIKEPSLWQDFFERISPYSFLHSYSWGQVEKSLGRKVYYLGIFDNDKLIGICLAVITKAKRGKFLAVPHGPLFENFSWEVFASLVDFLKEIAKKQNCWFIRIASLLEKNNPNIQQFKNLGFSPAPLHLYSENTWIKFISSSDEAMLQEMNKQTRKIIEEIQHESSIEIEEVKEFNEKFEIFWRMYLDLAKRKKFTPWSRKLIENEFKIFARSNKAVLYLGKYQGKYLASALVIFERFGAFYHHGASYETKIPVSYKIQWFAIQSAKKRGCKFYNFWGVAPPFSQNHPWQGLTHFKKSFGGKLVEFVPTQDLALSPLYWLTWTIEKYRRFKRRL